MADTYEEEPETGESLLQWAWDLALTPVRMITSPTAIKAYLSVILFLTTSTILLTISSTAYGFFYYNYIPQIDLERVLYLQYGTGHSPYAVVELDTSALISQQAYDVELVLDMPRTVNNLDAGNFMLDLSLLGPGVNVKNVPDPVSSWLANITDNNVLYHSRRPAILPYSSPLVSLSHTVLHLPWHLMNFRDLDSSRLQIPMFELLTFPRGSRNVPTHARLQVQATTSLQVYHSKLTFRAKFQGLRYLIYNYRLTAFAIFTTLFYSVSLTTMAVAWAVISSLMTNVTDKPGGGLLIGGGRGGGRGGLLLKDENSLSQDPSGKSEHDSDSTQKRRRIKTEDEAESWISSFPGMTTAAPPPEDAPSAVKTEFEPPQSQQPPLSASQGEIADDEDDDDEEIMFEQRGRAFEADSGIGTSMESEHTRSGLTRRRSSRSVNNQ
ncbi:hypothetical protein PV10_00783 [Exophiala mesophila]|uniref:Seipin n=1 Tax=Exophiala mesophila TaxID=212818 RepID=A0A0D2ADL1_EXOME|nr:uncharacterized protein PV10_00783 [Exophiala mesophila]KIV96973.1 hypothetical protein PV10_00783 [Exophiala mesophila]